MSERKGLPPEQLDFFRDVTCDSVNASAPPFGGTASAYDRKPATKGHLSLVIGSSKSAPEPNEAHLLDAVLKQAAKLGW